ncbi:MAG: PAS domain S-box protein, partial [Candidatus Thermoplasmatota archaeon]|nr:PAS domain S-box protein [Candidatus Thermoplasmatota archaeon]
MDGKDPLGQWQEATSTLKVVKRPLRKDERAGYYEIFDLIKSGVAVYMAIDDGNDFTIVDINKAVERIESVIKKDVIGKKVTEIFPGVGLFGLLDVFRRVWRSGVPEQFPIKQYKDDRISGWRENYVFRSSDGNVIAVYDDLTEMKGSEEERLLNERRLESLYRISIYEKDDIQDFLDIALDEAIQLTGSKIGYLYFYDTMKKEFTLNSWSKGVMKECTIQEKQTVYQLEKTGIWGEAVRQGRPIIINDFQAPDPLKKGYPEGHASLSKFLTIPIFHKSVIEGVIGVANKETDYNSSDVRQLTLLMNYVWVLKKKKENEKVIKHLASFPELNPHIVIEFELDGAVKYLNPAAKRVFEGAKDSLRDLILPQDPLGLARDLNSSHDLTLEKEFVLGERTYLAYIAKPAGMDNFRVYAIDITERKQMEYALMENESRFRSVFETSNVGKSMTYPTGEIIVNKAFCEMLGYQPEELEHKKWQDLTPPEDIGTIQRIIDPLLKGERDSARFEKRYVHKNGSYLWADVSTVMKRDKQGRPLHFITTIVDISDKKKAEEEITDLNSFLLSVRNINQTITWSDDFKALLTESARILAETRGYQNVTVAYRRDIDELVEHRSCRKGVSTCHMTTDWTTLQVPFCIEEIFRTGVPRTFDSHSTECEKCNMYNAEDDHEHILVPIKAEDGPVHAVIQI